MAKAKGNAAPKAAEEASSEAPEPDVQEREPEVQEDTLPKGKTVTMIFPKGGVRLLIKHDQPPLIFPEGPQEVPEEHADHFYLKCCGVKRYGKKE